MRRNKYKLAWLLTVLLAVTLACNALAEVGQDARDLRNTADAAIDQVQSVATQAQIIASTVESSGILQTAQILATERGGEYLSTFEALATEAAERGVLETAQAVVTEQGSEIAATARAMATEGISFGAAPDDIPILPEGEVVNFFGSNQLVSYTATRNFQEVLVFYKQEMPVNGWVFLTEASTEFDDNANLVYEKSGRKAEVMLRAIPFNQNTLVIITLE